MNELTEQRARLSKKKQKFLDDVEIHLVAADISKHFVWTQESVVESINLLVRRGMPTEDAIEFAKLAATHGTHPATIIALRDLGLLNEMLGFPTERKT